ncbi:hypothetical protein ETB97_007787 [Aspergillus alliaceus]|uniref:Uncharacterized protein n=1 Tax=Petromyces alliaceus TaxID=209559 RepID=A0A8H5ZUZ4_PETAA|nr:hypothetical protein ETB97_007787 [Aspergillus burnettii]
MLDYLYQEDYDDYELAIELQAQGYLVYANTASQECEVLQMMACVDGHNGPTSPARNNKRTKAYANAMMYVTAAKYTIRGLEDLAEKKLVSNLIHEWKDADFIQLIEYVYGPHTPTNPKLQVVVATSATRHISTLQEFQPFHRVLKEFPHFMYIFSSQMMERVVQLEKELL